MTETHSIFSMTNTTSPRTTHMAIKFIFFITALIIFTNTASALNFTISAPQSISQLQEFSVQIVPQDTPNANYDVKIYVHDDVKKDSEIFFDNAWKSPFNYLRAVFPQTKEFTIRANYTGQTKLCVKLRNANKTSDVTEVCNEISVQASEQQQTSKEQNSNQQNTTKIETKNKNAEEDNKSSSDTTSKITNLTSVTTQQPTQKKSNEKIILTAPKGKTPTSNTYLTKDEKLRFGIIYGFTFVCLIIIVLLALKKL